jgi:ComF family protein
MSVLRKIWAKMLDFVFPRSCVGCGVEDTWYCNRCVSWVRPMDENQCFSCFKPSSTGRTCEKCLSRADVHLDGLVVAGHYHRNKELAKAVHGLKYSRRTDEISEKLGFLLRAALEKNLGLRAERLEKIVLIPVPLHRKRLKERGFNQAELLARALCCVSSETMGAMGFHSETGTSIIIDVHLLERSEETKSQVEVGKREGRLKNLAGAFRLLKKPDMDTVYFLVDDVCTTGATLSVCAEVLKKAGAGKVWGLAVMKA